jgi:hypothetical protein
LRFCGVTPLEDVEGVSFDRWVLVLVLVWGLVGSPFELPDVCGDPPFGCELIGCEPNTGGVDGDVDGGAADGGSLSIGRGFNVDPRTVG